MRAIYLEKEKLLKEKDIPIPKYKSNQVLVKVKSVGICGSDMHYWIHGKIGKFIVEKPMILGHEVAGEIVELGDEVKDFKKGDMVVIEPGVPCGKCWYCTNGRYNLCPDMTFFATPPVDGALCEYIAHDSQYVFKIPEGIDADVATLVEPLAVGTHATRKVGVKLGDKVLIYGSGVIGLCCMIAAKEAGASEVSVVDIRDDRLEVARKFGANEIVNVKNNSARAGYYDIAYECTGVQDSLIDAGRTVRAGGNIVLIGLGQSSTQSAPIVDFIINEQNLISVFRYAHVFPTALNIIAKNKDVFKQMITHSFNIDQAEKAFITARDDKTAIKVIINI